jgi:hypothetical protein
MHPDDELMTELQKRGPLRGSQIPALDPLEATTEGDALRRMLHQAQRDVISLRLRMATLERELEKLRAR